MGFQLPKLPYTYDALEPYIDAKTMEIHYSKHHQAYTDKLNAAIQGTYMEGRSIEEILEGLDLDNKAVRNNGGGYYNHNLFWEILSPNGGGQPEGVLLNAINASFGNFEKFKEKFSTVAISQFGSGWAWLCSSEEGELSVCSTANQDNPIMKLGCGNRPILGLDIWEHAYYLNYQNRRPDYIEAFFNVINWDKVSEFYTRKS